MSAGKGDTPRPVNGDAYRDNYEDIFRKKQSTEPEEWHPRGIEWKPGNGRMLRSGERLQDGDEVYVGNDKWETLYLANFQEEYVRNGLYRRKGEDRTENLWCPLDEDTVPEYRVLEEGELIQEGDEFWDELDGKWKETAVLKDMGIKVISIGLYRRKGEDRHHGAAE